MPGEVALETSEKMQDGIFGAITGETFEENS